jgi:hypothetical protein
MSTGETKSRLIPRDVKLPINSINTSSYLLERRTVEHERSWDCARVLDKTIRQGRHALFNPAYSATHAVHISRLFASYCLIHFKLNLISHRKTQCPQRALVAAPFGNPVGNLFGN